MDKQLRQAILQELDLTKLSHEESDKIIISLGGLILERVMVKVADSLSDENVILFEEVIGTGDMDSIQRFLEEKVPDLDEVVQESSKEVVNEYKISSL